MSTFNLWNSIGEDVLLNLKDNHKENLIQNCLNEYFLADESIYTIEQHFEEQISAELKNSDLNSVQDPTVLGMKVTFYTELFNGTEHGQYVVVYLNIHHLLLIHAQIQPGCPVKFKKQYFMVSEDLRKRPYIKIFEFLCECLKEFFSKYDLLGKVQILGFSSDMPVFQFGIDQCKVWYFTPTAADFPLNCYDVKQCFEIVLRKERYRDLKINLVAIFSDKISMLVQTSYTCGPVDMFVDLEKDCNILYWENLANVNKWKSADGTDKPESVLIDTELRNFGVNGCLNMITTDLEWSSDGDCLKPDKHASIKRFISQLNVLELIRHILLDLHHNLLYCRQSDIGNLNSNRISLESLCAFAKCRDVDHSATILPGGTIGGSVEDAKVAKYVCSVVLKRAAILTGICLASLMSRFNMGDLVIAVNCSMLEKHPDYETYLRIAVQKFAPGKKFQFIWTKDSKVCEGAVLATSIANRLDRSNLRF